MEMTISKDHVAEKPRRGASRQITKLRKRFQSYPVDVREITRDARTEAST